ncbi:MAG: SAM-dependent methyltransferase, partial [Actinomycetaceae bacterium UMB1218B]|nr:SAM-dependent methyltransferase [Actinomycetaceae bacterium UMB1218B]
MVATSVGVMNESEVAVANTPIVDPALIACLRSDFDDAGWYVDALKQVVSQRALTALGREQRVPALVELRAQTAPISVLTRLFMLGDTVAGQQLDQALPTCGVAGAVSLGLAQPVADSSSPSRYRATVDLRPYSAVIPDVMVSGGSDSDSTRQLNWWIASDLTSMVTGGALRPDHVLGVGGASTSLLEMTIRKPFT